MTERRPNRRRYQRLPKKHQRRFSPTDRDLDILALVGEHRFLDTPHILSTFASTEGARRRVRERVRLLFDGGYLDLVRRPVDVRTNNRQGSEPNIYALGDKGADFLAEELGIPRARSSQRDKNREVKERHLDHSLLTAELMIPLEREARNGGEVELIYGEELGPQAELDERKRYRWRVSVPWKDPQSGKEQTFNDISVHPDKTFALEYLELPEGENRLLFFVEADRGTESQIPKRKLSTKTTVFRKYLGLYATARQGLDQELFGIRGFRVLTVALGRRRMEGMMKTAMYATGGRAPNQFLFTDRATLAEYRDNILELPWVTAEGKMVTLGG